LERVRLKLFVAILVLILAPPALAADADPLAPGRAGQAQCFTPDEKAKTCRQIVTFTFGLGGVIETHASTAMNDNLVMHHGGPVTIRNGAVCRRLATDDLERATFSLGGKSASPADTEALRAEIKKEYAGLIGKELCTSYRPAGRLVAASLTIDGVSQTDVADTVLWVNSKDGYKLVP
jgi:hypothetical protein